ncbi:CPBP family glutamic-type intramembrane protease [Telmatobacter sp. DSM 110680]|uniref:CPBP family glutamic-type intramembrane protease n=1 Tax=Telmatobacter sp. DSM 110680 TaxID=3036704 RepID=A0AAU7DI18_9BACT
MDVRDRQSDPPALPGTPQNTPASPNSFDVSSAIVGPHGIRAGWLVLLFYCLFRLFVYILSAIVYAAAPDLVGSEVSPLTALLSELVPFFAMIAAGAIMLPVAQRRLADYNLRDTRAVRHFVGGTAIGLVSLSALVGSLELGGWAHIGRESLSLSRILTYAGLWALTFLLVGCVEEGVFRCYAQATLVRGINFWWALAMVSGLCLYARMFVSGDCTWGVCAFAALGILPCFLLHLKSAENSRFWQAAWATSTGFGFVHTLNHGENWIGIFAAAFIGFAFCVSIKVTGSAWWAIGCHAAWDWAETYLWGTADSGFVAPGHVFGTSPSGNPLWSGGTDGPEGSLLIIPIVLLMLAWLVVIYRRPRPAEISAPAATEQLAS